MSKKIPYCHYYAIPETEDGCWFIVEKVFYNEHECVRDEELNLSVFAFKEVGDSEYECEVPCIEMWQQAKLLEYIGFELLDYQEFPEENIERHPMDDELELEECNKKFLEYFGDIPNDGSLKALQNAFEEGWSEGTGYHDRKYEIQIAEHQARNAVVEAAEAWDDIKRANQGTLKYAYADYVPGESELRDALAKLREVKNVSRTT